MSQGKRPRSGPPTPSSPHKPPDAAPAPQRDFVLPPGYYDHYGISRPAGAVVQDRWGGRRGWTPPLGLLEYYGVRTTPPAPEAAAAAQQKEGAVPPAAEPEGSETSAEAAPTAAAAEAVAVQAKQGGGVAGNEAVLVREAAARGTSGAGGPLPYLDEIQSSFGRHNVREVRAHTDWAAARASRSMGAEAFTTGQHVAFAGSPSLHTAAHEAAHVVQQRAGVQLKGGVGEVGDAYERHADAVADRVVQGQSSEVLLDEMTGGGRVPAAVQRQRKEGGEARASGAHVGTLIGLLDTPDPIAGVGDFDGAFRFLNGLGMGDLLATLQGAADRGYLPLLLEHQAAAAHYDAPRLLAALHTVALARTPPSKVSMAQLNETGTRLDQLSSGEQLAIYAHILARRGISIAVKALMEGATALRESEVAVAEGVGGVGTQGVPAGAGGATAPKGVGPGPWNPPGNQPISLYIGNTAHESIAKVYEVAHPVDQVESNHIAISSLLIKLGEMMHKTDSGNLTEAELRLRPDITNLTRLHLYETKPLADQGQGAAEAITYVGVFRKAGVAMTLGPVGEPGTSGAVPAPGGVYLFWSPEPGVIVYQYRRGRLVPVEVEVPEPSSERRWKLELQPLTREQQQGIITTTFSGAILMIIMLLLSPVGA